MALIPFPDDRPAAAHAQPAQAATPPPAPVEPRQSPAASPKRLIPFPAAPAQAVQAPRTPPPATPEDMQRMVGATPAQPRQAIPSQIPTVKAPPTSVGIGPQHPAVRPLMDDQSAPPRSGLGFVVAPPIAGDPTGRITDAAANDAGLPQRVAAAIGIDVPPTALESAVIRSPEQKPIVINPRKPPTEDMPEVVGPGASKFLVHPEEDMLAAQKAAEAPLGLIATVRGGLMGVAKAAVGEAVGTQLRGKGALGGTDIFDVNQRPDSEVAKAAARDFRIPRNVALIAERTGQDQQSLAALQADLLQASTLQKTINKTAGTSWWAKSKQMLGPMYDSMAEGGGWNTGRMFDAWRQQYVGSAMMTAADQGFDVSKLPPKKFEELKAKLQVLGSVYSGIEFMVGTFGLPGTGGQRVRGAGTIAKKIAEMAKTNPAMATAMKIAMEAGRQYFGETFEEMLQAGPEAVANNVYLNVFGDLGPTVDIYQGPAAIAGKMAQAGIEAAKYMPLATAPSTMMGAAQIIYDDGKTHEKRTAATDAVESTKGKPASDRAAALRKAGFDKLADNIEFVADNADQAEAEVKKTLDDMRTRGIPDEVGTNLMTAHKAVLAADTAETMDKALTDYEKASATATEWMQKARTTRRPPPIPMPGDVGTETPEHDQPSAENDGNGEMTLVHGSSSDRTSFNPEQSERAQKRGPLDDGRVDDLGVGFFTDSDSVARTFGNRLTRVKVRLTNPLRITGVEWAGMRGTAGGKPPKQFGRQQPGDTEYFKRVRAWAEARGHDGIIITPIPEAERKNFARGLHREFAHHQVIPFSSASVRVTGHADAGAASQQAPTVFGVSGKTRSGAIPVGADTRKNIDPKANAPEQPTDPAAAAVKAAADKAATSQANDLPEPTEAQKEAGNYQKGHVRVSGLDISIENPAGSQRQKDWAPLQDHYGYVKGTESHDGEQVDVFINPDHPESDTVYVVDQVDPKTGKFDESKGILGARSQAEAEAIYDRNYPADWKGRARVRAFTQDEFKAWLNRPPSERGTSTIEGPRQAIPTPDTISPPVPAQGEQPPAGQEPRGGKAAPITEGGTNEAQDQGRQAPQGLLTEQQTTKSGQRAIEGEPTPAPAGAPSRRQAILTEPSSTPTMRSTEDAEAYGRTIAGDQDAIARLDSEAAEFDALTAASMAKADEPGITDADRDRSLNSASDFAFRAQLRREAADTARKTATKGTASEKEPAAPRQAIPTDVRPEAGQPQEGQPRPEAERPVLPRPEPLTTDVAAGAQPGASTPAATPPVAAPTDAAPPQSTAWTTTAATRAKQGLNPHPTGTRIPKTTVRTPLASPLAINGTKGAGIANSEALRGLYAALARWGNAVADLFAGGGVVDLFMAEEGHLKGKQHIMSEWEPLRAIAWRRIAGPTYQNVASQAETMMNGLVGMMASAEKIVKEASGTNMGDQIIARVREYLMAMPDPSGGRATKQSREIAADRVADLFTSYFNAEREDAVKAGGRFTEADARKAASNSVRRQMLRWWAEVMHQTTLAPGQDLAAIGATQREWGKTLADLSTLAEALSPSEPKSKEAQAHMAAVKAARPMVEARVAKLKEKLDSMVVEPPALTDDDHTAAVSITLQWAMGSQNNAQTQLNDDGTLRNTIGIGVSVNPNRIDTVLDAIRKAHDLLQGADVRRADSWKLIESLPAGTSLVVDPSYFGKNRKREGTSNYGVVTEIKTPEDLLHYIDTYLLPAWARGSRMVITNTWDNWTANQLQLRGFNVTKFQRSGNEDELVAWNFAPDTGTVFSQPPGAQKSPTRGDQNAQPDATRPAGPAEPAPALGMGIPGERGVPRQGMREPTAGGGTTGPAAAGDAANRPGSAGAAVRRRRTAPRPTTPAERRAEVAAYKSSLLTRGDERVPMKDRKDVLQMAVDEDAHTLKNPLFRTLYDFARALGVDVVFVKSLGSEGVNLVHRPQTIFVRTGGMDGQTADVVMVHALAHELLHALGTANPAAYSAMVARIKSLATGWPEWRTRAARLWKTENDAVLTDELVADALGEIMATKAMRERFLRGMATENPGLLRQIIDVLTTLMDHVRTLLDEAHMASYAFDNFNAVIDELAAFVAEAEAAKTVDNGPAPQFSPTRSTLPGWTKSTKPGFLIGWRGEHTPGLPSAEQMARNDGGTEGVGLYIARDRKLASEFRGRVRKVEFPAPVNPLLVDDEPLHILQETDDVMNPPSPTDSPWLAAHKEAIRRTGITDETWPKKQVQLQRALTDVLLERGHDAVHVKAGDEWVVILAKPNEVLPFSPRRTERTARIDADYISDLLDRQYTPRNGRKSDETITLETYEENRDAPWMAERIAAMNATADEVDRLLEGVPYSRGSLLDLIATHDPLLEYDNPNSIWPVPVYVSAEGDENTIGLLLHRDGRKEMFEGNDEATGATLDLVTKLLGNGDQMVAVWTSQPSEIVQQIRAGNIPAGIYVSPNRQHAEGYWGEGRELTRFRLPMNRIAQESAVDWKVREAPAAALSPTRVTTAEINALAARPDVDELLMDWWDETQGTSDDIRSNGPRSREWRDPPASIDDLSRAKQRDFVLWVRDQTPEVPPTTMSPRRKPYVPEPLVSTRNATYAPPLTISGNKMFNAKYSDMIEEEKLRAIMTTDPKMAPYAVLRYWQSIGFSEIANNLYPDITAAFEDAVQRLPLVKTDKPIYRFQGYPTKQAMMDALASFTPGRTVVVRRPANAFSDMQEYGIDLATTYGGEYLIRFVVHKPHRARSLSALGPMKSVPEAEIVYARGDAHTVVDVEHGRLEGREFATVVLAETDAAAANAPSFSPRRRNDKPAIDPKTWKDLGKTPEGDWGFFLTPAGKLLDVISDFGDGSNDHVGFSLAVENSEALGVDKATAKAAADEIMGEGANGNSYNDLWMEIEKAGNVRVRFFDARAGMGMDPMVSVQFLPGGRAGIKKLQDMLLNGIIPSRPNILYSIETNNDAGLKFFQILGSEDILAAKSTKELESRNDYRGPRLSPRRNHKLMPIDVPIIGYVGTGGEVLTEQDPEEDKEHESIWPALSSIPQDRFRISKDLVGFGPGGAASVNWWEAPTDEARIAVDNWIARRYGREGLRHFLWGDVGKEKMLPPITPSMSPRRTTPDILRHLGMAVPYTRNEGGEYVLNTNRGAAIDNLTTRGTVRKAFDSTEIGAEWEAVLDYMNHVQNHPSATPKQKRDALDVFRQAKPSDAKPARSLASGPEELPMRLRDQAVDGVTEETTTPEIFEMAKKAFDDLVEGRDEQEMDAGWFEELRTAVYEMRPGSMATMQGLSERQAQNLREIGTTPEKPFTIGKMQAYRGPEGWMARKNKDLPWVALRDGNRTFLTLRTGLEARRQDMLTAEQAEDEGVDVPFSPRRAVTPEQNAAYMKAVEAGDMEAAQRMVNEAAKAAGYSTLAYHGTSRAWTVYDYAKAKPFTEGGKKGRRFIHVTTSPDVAKGYSGIETGMVIDHKDGRVHPVEKVRRDIIGADGVPEVKKLFVRMDAPVAVDAGGKQWDTAMPTAKAYLLAGNHDSAIVENVIDSAHAIDRVTMDTKPIRAERVVATTILLRDPSQIKSADAVTRDDAGNVIPLSQRFNEQSDDIRFSPTRSRNWSFSRLLRAIETFPAGATEPKTGQQWKGWIAKMGKAATVGKQWQGGVSKAEIEWTGINDWLKDGQRYTRAQVADYVRAHQVQLTVTVRKDAPSDADERDMAELKKLGYEIQSDDGERGYLSKNGEAVEITDAPPAVQEFAKRILADGATKYAERYVLPGGTNQREITLSMPPPEPPERTTTELPVGYSLTPNPFGGWNLEGGGNSTRIHTVDRAAAVREAVGVLRNVTRNRGTFTSSHFPEPNIVVHYRTNDRVRLTYTPEQIADIKRRMAKAVNGTVDSVASGAARVAVRKGLITEREAEQFTHATKWNTGYGTKAGSHRTLLIEEIQSDLHQKGRKHGYQKPWPEAEIAKFTVDPSKEKWVIRIPARQLTYEEAETEVASGNPVIVNSKREGSDYVTALSGIQHHHNQYGNAKKGVVFYEVTTAQDETGLSEYSTEDAALEAAQKRTINQPYYVIQTEGQGEVDFTVRDGNGRVLATPPKAFKKTPEAALALIQKQAREGTLSGMGAVPDLPFKDSSEHGLLAFKHLLRYAAEQGYDAIAWTPGQVQIDRYNEAMRQNVDRITVEPEPVSRPSWTSVDNSTTTMVKVEAYKDGQGKFSERVPLTGTATVAGKQDIGLEDVIGKELADKVRAAPDRQHDFTGDNLAIGGQGMKEFYDKKLPGLIEKYVAKWGGKIGTTELKKASYSSATQAVLPKFKAFDKYDEQSYGGADNFTDGKPPMIAQVKVRVGGEEMDSEVIIDGAGIQIWVNGEDFSAWWADIIGEADKTTKDMAIESVLSQWDEPRSSLWKAVNSETGDGGKVTFAEGNRVIPAQQVTITPRMRFAALHEQPLLSPRRGPSDDELEAMAGKLHRQVEPGLLPHAIGGKRIPVDPRWTEATRDVLGAHGYERQAMEEITKLVNLEMQDGESYDAKLQRMVEDNSILPAVRVGVTKNIFDFWARNMGVQKGEDYRLSHAQSEKARNLLDMLAATYGRAVNYMKTFSRTLWSTNGAVAWFESMRDQMIRAKLKPVQPVVQQMEIQAEDMRKAKSGAIATIDEVGIIKSTLAEFQEKYYTLLNDRSLEAAKIFRKIVETKEWKTGGLQSTTVGTIKSERAAAAKRAADMLAQMNAPAPTLSPARGDESGPSMPMKLAKEVEDYIVLSLAEDYASNNMQSGSEMKRLAELVGQENADRIINDGLLNELTKLAKIKVTKTAAASFPTKRVGKKRTTVIENMEWDTTDLYSDENIARAAAMAGKAAGPSGPAPESIVTVDDDAIITTNEAGAAITGPVDVAAITKNATPRQQFGELIMWAINNPDKAGKGEPVQYPAQATEKGGQKVTITPTVTVEEAIESGAIPVEVAAIIPQSLKQIPLGALEQWSQGRPEVEPSDIYAGYILRPNQAQAVESSFLTKRANQYMRDIGMTLRQLVEQHYSQQKQTKVRLANLLKEELGLQPYAALIVAGAVDRHMEKAMEAQRQKSREAFKKMLQNIRPGRKLRRDIDELMRLINLGVLERHDITNEWGKLLGIPEMTPEIRTGLQKRAEAIRTAPDAVKQYAVAEMVDYIEQQMPKDAWRLVTTYMYANLLSGYADDTRNVVGNLSNDLINLMATAASNPKAAPMLFAGAFRRAAAAPVEILAALRGQAVVRTAGKLEYKGELKFDGRISNLISGAVHIPFRMLTAADMLAFKPQAQRYAEWYAFQTMLRDGVPYATAWRQAIDSIHGTAQERAEWKRQAEALFPDSKLRQARAAEDIRLRVTSDRAPEAVAYGQQMAAAYTLNTIPEDAGFGKYHHTMSGLLNPTTGTGPQKAGMRLFGSWVGMFSRIATNMAIMNTSYLPGLGMASAITEKDAVRKRVLWARQGIGLIATAALVLLDRAARTTDDDDDEQERERKKLNPSFAIYGAGPVDAPTRNAMRRLGWSPYTVKIGDRYWKYQVAAGPLAFVFTAVGVGMDYDRGWRLGKSAKTDAAGQGAHIAIGIVKAFTEMSFLSGLSQFFTAIGNADMGDKPAKAMLISQMNKLFPSAAIRTLKEFGDANIYETETFGAALTSTFPYAAHAADLRPRLDLFGQPLTRQGHGEGFWKHMAGIFTAAQKEDPLVQWLVANNAIWSPRQQPDDMHPDDYYAASMESGKAIRAKLERYYAKPENRKKPSDVIEADVDEIVREEWKAARSRYPRTPADK